jgi:5-methylcytosine-specific restriction endonuclease McrA
MNEHRVCERQCRTCGIWKHHSRFRPIPDFTSKVRTVRFRPDCRDCEQKARNEKRNTDRPLAIIRGRATKAARKAGVSTEFFWEQMNYRALVPQFRATVTDDGLCLSCGHSFLNERDIHIEHIEPPRGQNDWARLHARNLRLFCASCNGTKSNKPFAAWLDEQEGARLSNLKEKEVRPLPPPYEQLSMSF